MIHRDLKPANVLVDDIQGEEFMVRVADFGIAKLDPEHNAPRITIEHVHTSLNRTGASESLTTSPGVRLGTPAYIAPEQAFAKDIDAQVTSTRLGFFCLKCSRATSRLSQTQKGLCLEHLHTPPKPVNSVDTVLRIEPEIEALLLRLKAKDPIRRPSSAKSVIRVIDEVLARIAPQEAQHTAPMPLILPSSLAPEKTLEDEPVELPSSGLPRWLWPLLGGMIVGGIVMALLH